MEKTVAGFLSRDSEENLFVRNHTQRKLSYDVISDLSRLNPVYIFDKVFFPDPDQSICSNSACLRLRKNPLTIMSTTLDKM